MYNLALHNCQILIAIDGSITFFFINLALHSSILENMRSLPAFPHHRLI